MEVVASYMKAFSKGCGNLGETHKLGLGKNTNIWPDMVQIVT
jgi:hypothetical protein